MDYLKTINDAHNVRIINIVDYADIVYFVDSMTIRQCVLRHGEYT